MMMKTSESELLPHYKYKLVNIAQIRSQKISQPVIITRIGQTWPKSYLIKKKKKLQAKH